MAPPSKHNRAIDDQARTPDASVIQLKHRAGGSPSTVGGLLLVLDSWDFHVDVDAVEEGTREACLVASDRELRAGAGAEAVAVVQARERFMWLLTPQAGTRSATIRPTPEVAFVVGSRSVDGGTRSKLRRGFDPSVHWQPGNPGLTCPAHVRRMVGGCPTEYVPCGQCPIYRRGATLIGVIAYVLYSGRRGRQGECGLPGRHSWRTVRRTRR